MGSLRERARIRMGDGAFTRPHRPTFHHLMTLTQGTLRHTVDFTEYALEPGAWLWVRPGQVHQWGDLTGVEGTLLLFEQGFLDPATAAAARVDDPHAGVVQIPAGADREALDTAAAQVERHFLSLGRLPLDAHLAVLRHLLAVVVLNLAHLTNAAGNPVPEPGEAFVRFRAAVERNFARTRRLDDYAKMLGYSARTLSRACLADAGIGAKEFIDGRVLLEAKRMLAHGEQPASRIAANLGFSSATNFSKFFHQRTATSPIVFRAAVRGHTGTRH